MVYWAVHVLGLQLEGHGAAWLTSSGGLVHGSGGAADFKTRPLSQFALLKTDLEQLLSERLSCFLVGRLDGSPKSPQVHDCPLQRAQVLNEGLPSFCRGFERREPVDGGLRLLPRTLRLLEEFAARSGRLLLVGGTSKVRTYGVRSACERRDSR